MNIREIVTQLGFADENTAKGQVTRAKKVMLGLGVGAKLTDEQKLNDEFSEELVKEFLITVATGKSIAKDKAEEILLSIDENLDVKELAKAKNRAIKQARTSVVKEKLEELEELQVQNKYLKRQNLELAEELGAYKKAERSAKSKEAWAKKKALTETEEPTVTE